MTLNTYLIKNSEWVPIPFMTQGQIKIENQ